jgi:hypothetical protein
MRFAIFTASNDNTLAVNPRAVKCVVYNATAEAEGDLSVGIEFIGEDEELPIKQSFEVAIKELNEALNYDRTDLAGDKRRSGLAAARCPSDSASGPGFEPVSGL